MSCFYNVNGGFFATKGKIESEMWHMAKEKDIEIKETSYEEVYDMILQHYDMYSRAELHKMANAFVEEFIDEFGIREFIIWYEVSHKNAFVDEDLAMKYYKTLETHKSFIKYWIQKNKFKYYLELFFLGREIKKKYNTMGVGFYTSNEFVLEIVEQLWGVIKTIRDSCYNKELIRVLNKEIKNLLRFCGNSYYLEQDLTDKKVIKELYYELCEVTHHSDGYKGHEMFYNYDGYGNTIYETSGRIREEW